MSTGDIITGEEYKKLLKENPEKAKQFKYTPSVTPQQIAKRKVGRNELCPCGSGKKFKHCCANSVEKGEKVVHDEGMRENKILDPPKQRFRSLFNISSFILNPTFELVVLKHMRYKGSIIYVFQYRNMFQYLFAINSEIYQNHFFLKPKIWRKVLSLFGKPLYSKEELDYGEQVMITGAQKSLDVLTAKADPIPLEK